ncbi:S-layer homology domain-containing protein [Paenibacillus sp. Soil750]|uniref:S-layer homology domain-containing protein n=1 Tax=Paenibacillus sp. Soil750 TaxID=1736398 RepID=UPI0009E7D670|nr:S-layer homology domain-containing protein [Paenibacillus sp. Soil750]
MKIMVLRRFMKRLSALHAALLLLSLLQVFLPLQTADAAVQEFPISLQLNNMDSTTNLTGDIKGTADLAVVNNSDPQYIKEGTGSKKWLLAFNNGADVAGSALIYPKLAPNVDLNGYSTMKIWAYSIKARTGDQADKPIQLRFYMKGDTSNYYYYRVLLDWTGWKEIEVPLSVVKTQKSIATLNNWGSLDYVRFDQAAIANTTLDLGLQIYLDDFRLTNTASVQPVTADKASGEYANKVTVSLSSLSTPAILTKIYYKRVGIDSAFQLYTTPLTLTSNGEQTANVTLVTKSSINNIESEETSYQYSIIYRDYVETVNVNPPAGLYAETKSVTLSSPTVGAAVYYKIEGVDNAYKLYTTPLVVDHSQTVTTKAEFEGKVSEVKSYTYNIDLSGSSSIPIGNMETFAGWTNTTATSEIPAVLGTKSGKWTDPTTAINVTGMTGPWKQNDQIEFWMYSEKASNKKVYFILECNVPTPGFDYFMSTFYVDWVGWKKVEVPFNKMLNSTGLADLANFNQVIIHPNWYNLDVSDPTDKLYFDGFALAKNAVESSIKQIDKSTLPDSTLNYTFSLKNISDVDTAYQISPKTAFGPGYDVTVTPTTAVVAKGAETDVNLQVKVPASAQAGDVQKAIYTVKPLQGGKEITIELNAKVGAPRVATKQHPYIMTSQTQLNEAKAKIQSYGWAEDYLNAIKVKADSWLNKTVYYPSKPAGESGKFVCGDTPLVFNYDKPHEHLCPTDNQIYTGSDVDAGWRFTAHTVNIEAVRNLALTYALSGEAKYAQKAKEMLLNYAELYPSYAMQALNGRLYYQSLDEAVQMIELVQAYDLIEPSGLLSAAEKYNVEQNLFAPSAKTLQGYDVGKSNWQTWHNAAIGAVGAALEDKTLMDFSVTGKSGFNFQMANSVLSDGFWYEGAIGYHFYAQSALFFHAQALKNMGYDLFASPNFKKTFDVTLQYAFPDLGIINSNDSGKYPTNLGAPGRVVPMDYEGVYAEYNDADYGTLLSMLYNDRERARGGFIVPGNTNSGIVGEQAVFYGKSVIPNGGTLPSESMNFTGLGHSVLRAGIGEEQLYALVDYGVHGGYHGHPDKLHLEVFGKGERLAPDLGIPPYSNSMYTSYYKTTFSHNTVMVDGDTQAIPTVNNVEVYEPTKLFMQSKPFNIMTNTSSKAYAGMGRYERTVAVTKDYMIDLFTLESATRRQYDWLLHGIGAFTPGTTMDTFAGPLGTKDSTPFFRNGTSKELSGSWEGAWNTVNGNGLKLFSLTSSPSATSTMIVGEAPGPGNDTAAYTPTVVNRVYGNNAQFVSVLEPYKGTSKIENVRRTDPTHIVVDMKDGRKQLFYSNSEKEVAGQLQYYFVDGLQQTAENVDITTNVNTNELQLAVGELSGVSSVTTVTYAPSTTKVLWNGSEVPFTKDNGFVMVSVNVSSAPVLTADVTTNDTLSAIDITFTEDAAWRAAITAVKDGTTTLSPTDYTIQAGKITIHAGVLGEGSHIVTVKAANYQDAVVTQVILLGVPVVISNDALLSDLGVDQGIITFESAQLSYNVEVPNSVTSLILTVSKAHANQTLTVTGATYRSVTGSVYTYTVNDLQVGSNLIDIQVTAEDGIAMNPYQLRVNRLPEVPVVSSNADLSGLTLSTGVISPAFAAGTTSYSLNVPNSVSRISVTANVYDSHALMTVNGVSTSSGQASGGVNLQVGTNEIKIVVTAQNGSSKSYTVTVRRGADNSSSSPSPSTSTNQPIVSKNGTLTLPQGKTGEVSLNNEVKIIIPADASAKELKVTIDKVLDTAKLITSKEVLASPIFEILKNFSENFSKPITLTFAFDKTSLKADQKAAVFYYDEVNKVWIEVPGGKVNGDQITIDVNHLTKYAVFAVNQTTVVPEISNLRDIAGHWAEADIRAALKMGIVDGYEDGSFKPNQFVSRAEFIVMLMNALHPNAGAEKLPNYSDGDTIGDWAKQAIALAAKSNLVQGYEDSTFRPGNPLTRAQLAVVLANAYAPGTSGVKAVTFADVSDIPAWALEAVGIVQEAGLMQGYAENLFGPLATVTRAEAITVITRLLPKQASK